MAVHAENRARVEAALSQVPEPFRTTLILRDIEGFVYEEVAEMQGVNLGTVKSRLVRGRACLKALLTAPKPEARSLATHGIRDAPGRGGAMNGCSAMQAKFSEYLDGRLNGREMQQIAAHLDGCRECAGEWDALQAGAVVACRAGSGAGAGGSAAAHSRGREPGAGAQPQELLRRLGTGLEKHGRAFPAAGGGRICQRGAAAGHGHRAGGHVYAA